MHALVYNKAAILARRVASSQARAIAEGGHIVQTLNSRIRFGLPERLGIQIDAVSTASKTVDASMLLQEHHLAPNGYCHAGSVISLADTACGAGTAMTLPANAKNFTTIELKSNFVGTALEGVITCRATQLHGGRSTQLWEATVVSPAGKPMAFFRATQLVLYK